jgi:diguanylate cyclase (GGDEF)-like protein
MSERASSVGASTGRNGLAGCVRELGRATAGTGYVPLSPVEVEDLLRGLVGRLVDALFAEPFQTRPGDEVGHALVEADFLAPEMLGRTVQTLGGRLLSDLGADSAELRRRLAGLLGGVSAGYARGLRDRARSEQEAVARAMMRAQHLAEKAVRDSEQRRWWEARHDPLTGLANRALFTERLAAVLAEPEDAAEAALFLLTVDRFAAINDCLGHDAGDSLLAAVARRLAGHLGPAGHLLARTGTAEFAVLATGMSSSEDADEVAGHATATLDLPVDVGTHSLRVRASGGLVYPVADRASAAAVMHRAETALRWASADGGGRWLRFDPARHADDMARWALAAALPAALERGELTLHYQPVFGLADRAVLGVEALVRWRHPERGLLEPREFLGLAEETELTVPLGRWVLEQACREARRWSRPGSPYVSVNLAVPHTRQPGLVDDVARLLAKTGLEPSRLQLELTEGAFAEPGDSADTIGALADLGVRVAIDDFGAGWANYACLRALPACEVKLADAFVTGLHSARCPDPVDEVFVTGLIRLVHTLGLTVTAQGVETATQADQLHALGCDAGQGWYFGRPGPAGRLTELLGRA